MKKVLAVNITRLGLGCSDNRPYTYLKFLLSFPQFHAALIRQLSSHAFIMLHSGRRYIKLECVAVMLNRRSQLSPSSLMFIIEATNLDSRRLQESLAQVADKRANDACSSQSPPAAISAASFASFSAPSAKKICSFPVVRSPLPLGSLFICNASCFITQE